MMGVGEAGARSEKYRAAQYEPTRKVAWLLHDGIGNDRKEWCGECPVV